MQARTKVLTTFSLALLISVTGFAAPNGGGGPYGFPFRDPLMATIMSYNVSTTGKYETLSIEPKPERSNVRFLENRNQLILHGFFQDHEAPLAFVVAGFGGQGNSHLATLIADDLHKAGYHAVTVPDPMCWSYALSRSETGLPGYVPNDAKEFYLFLQEVTALLKTQRHLKISGYSLVGYSFGGLVSGFLEHEDLSQKIFNFQKVILMNPAIDVGFGISTLDKYYEAGDALTNHHKDWLMGALISLAVDTPPGKLTPDYVLKSFEKWGITTADEEWLVGASFRSDLTDIILTSQEIHDQGILKTPETKTERNAREMEAAQYSFEQYMLKFVFPETFGNTGTVDLKKTLEASGLYSLDDVLKNNSRVYVIENEDDMLLRAGDIGMLKSDLGDHLTVYPYGGHLGNLGFPQNRNDFINLVK